MFWFSFDRLFHLKTYYKASKIKIKSNKDKSLFKQNRL